MTKTSPDQDKTENLKTQTRQKWDSGQKRDTFETKVGQNWDKMRTVDKNETKVGILTLATSTPKSLKIPVVLKLSQNLAQFAPSLAHKIQNIS